MKLVPDWKEAWRWWSMRGLIIIMVIPPTWVMLPPDVKAMLPVDWEPWLLSVIAFATAFGRVKDQTRDL